MRAWFASIDGDGVPGRHIDGPVVVPRVVAHLATIARICLRSPITRRSSAGIALRAAMTTRHRIVVLGCDPPVP